MNREIPPITSIPPKESKLVDERLTTPEKPRIEEINADDTQTIISFLRLEIKERFLEIKDGKTIEDYAKIKQQEIQKGELKIIALKENGEVIASGIVVLKNGVLGKEIKENESWNAGIAVDTEKQKRGIGRQIVAEQNRIAKESGKDFILTGSSIDNAPSMRVILESGYRLNGIKDYRYNKDEEQPDKSNIYYRYRKALKDDGDELITMTQGKNWVDEVKEKKLELFDGDIDEFASDQILIDPINVEQVMSAINNGYKGVRLLIPKDFDDPKSISKNLVVFIRVKKVA